MYQPEVICGACRVEMLSASLLNLADSHVRTIDEQTRAQVLDVFRSLIPNLPLTIAFDERFFDFWKSYIQQIGSPIATDCACLAVTTNDCFSSLFRQIRDFNGNGIAPFLLTAATADLYDMRHGGMTVDRDGMTSRREQRIHFSKAVREIVHKVNGK